MQNWSPNSGNSDRLLSELAFTDNDEIVPAVSRRTSFDYESNRQKTTCPEQKGF